MFVIPVSMSLLYVNITNIYCKTTNTYLNLFEIKIITDVGGSSRVGFFHIKIKYFGISPIVHTLY